MVLDHRALTKIQSTILVVIILVAAVSVILIYFYGSGTPQEPGTIRIGVLADLDMSRGKSIMEGAVLAAEQINAAGGLLGKNIEIIGEDSDVEEANLDPTTAINALNRLITYHNVDFVIIGGGENFVIDTGVQHKKILFGTTSPTEALTQRLIDDYETYKYFFRLGTNETTAARDLDDMVLYVRDMTGFNKIGYLAIDIPQVSLLVEALEAMPKTYGVELVYTGKYPWGTTDFSSYFAAAEAVGVEIMVPITITQEGVPLVKEWYDRQSPMILWGINAAASIESSWNATEGKVENVAFPSVLALEGYAATSKTLATREAYINRWGHFPELQGAGVYDCIRFLLCEALEQAQTTETEAVIKALEEIEVENSLETNFRFTSSHDHYFGVGEKTFNGVFQWQSGGKLAIIYPKNVMEETRATYAYPDWSGPWNK